MAISVGKSLELYQADNTLFLWSGGGSLTAGSVVACGFILDSAGTVTSVKLSSGVAADAVLGPFTAADGTVVYVAYFLNVAGGETGIRPDTNGAGVKMVAIEYQGLASGGALDQGPGNVNNASASDFGAGPVTTTAADEALFAFGYNDSGFTISANAPYTLIGAVAGRQNGAYRILSATGSYGANIFHMGAGSTSTAAMLTFKDGGATPPTPGFSTAVDRKLVAITSTAVAGTNPITTTQYDYGDGSGRTATATHTYAVGGTYTVTQYVNDGVTAEQSTTHSVTTKTRYSYRVQTVGGRSATVTADRPDA